MRGLLARCRRFGLGNWARAGEDLLCCCAEVFKEGRVGGNVFETFALEGAHFGLFFLGERHCDLVRREDVDFRC